MVMTAPLRRCSLAILARSQWLRLSAYQTTNGSVSWSRSARRFTDISVAPDPALRLTESGRILLRLLSVQAISTGTRDDLVSSTPTDCLPSVAELARGCAEAWMQLAVEFDKRGESYFLEDISHSLNAVFRVRQCRSGPVNP